MPANSVSIRLGVEGQADLRRAFDDVAKSGQTAFDAVGKSMDQAGQASDKQLARFQKLAQAARDAESAGRAQSNINSLLGVGGGSGKSASDSASVFESALAASEKLEARTRALKNAIDPVAAAQDRMSASVKNADELLSAGTITVGEHAAAVALAKKGYEAFSGATKGANDNLELNRAQMAEGVHVVKSFVDQVVAGQDPMRALAVEGGRIGQILSSGSGGVGGTLRALGGMVVPYLVNPITLGVAALATAGVATVAFMHQQEDLERALNGVGRAAGVSVDGLRAIGVAGAKQGGLSSSQGIDLAGQFAAAGLDGRVMPGLIASSKQYSRAFGLDLSDAGTELAKSFADPTRGLDELEKRLGPFSDATRETVRRLQAQGDLEGARGTAFDAYNAKLKETAERTGYWTRFWDGAKGIASNAVQYVGSVIDPSTQQQIDSLQAKRNALQKSLDKGGLFNGVLGADDREIVAEYDRQIATLRSKQQQEQDEAKRKADQDDALRRSQDLGRTVRSLYPEMGQHEALEDRYKDLQKALGDPEVLKNTKVSADDAKRALEGTKFALDNFQTPLQRIATDSAVATASIMARSYAEREAVTLEQARVAAIRSGGDALTVAAEKDAARAKMLAESARKVDDLQRTSRDSLELVKLNPYQRAMREIDFKERDFREQNVPGVGTVQSGFIAVGTSATKLADVLTGQIGRITGTGGPSTGLPTFAQSNDLFAAIIKAEGTNRFGDPYNTSLGYMKSPKPLTDMTMNEVLAWGDKVRVTQGLNSSAKGAFQITNTTQRDAMSALGIGGDAMFSPENQRRMAMWIYQTQGSGAWEGFKKNGGVPTSGSADNLSKGSDAAFSDQRAARNYESTAKPIKDANDEINRQRALLDVQTAAWGKSTEETARASKEQELINQFMQQGVPITDDLRNGISGVADRYGALAKATEDAAERQRLILDVIDTFRSTSKSALGTFVTDLESGKRAGDALRDSLKRIIDTIQNKAIDSFVDSIFGRSGKSNGGLFNLFGGFGGSSSASAAGIGDIGSFFSSPGVFQLFAEGGIMTSRGKVPLNRYAGGGVANSPQVALFGEGRSAEAYVPLPDGKSIPVSMKLPKMTAPASNSAPKIVINNNGAPVEVERADYVTRDELHLTLKAANDAKDASSREASSRSW